MKILNLENENRKFTKSIENFHVMEYLQDSSVSPMTAMEEYYMSKMNVRRRQVVIELDKEHSAIIQSGAMQWMGGHVQATAGIKGIGDLFGKAIKGAMTMHMRFRSTNQTSFPETQRQQRQSRHGSAKCRRKTAV